MSSIADSHAGLKYAVESLAACGARDAAVQVWKDAGFGSGDPLDSIDQRRYDWFHVHNPAGPGIASFLTFGSERSRIGFLGVGARDFMLDGRKMPAGVLVDFVVHPAHRTALPALTLQKRTREHALHRMRLLYGLPDVKAVPIFRRLSSPVRFELPRYARVILTRTYLRRYLPLWLAAPLSWLVDVADAMNIRLQLILSGDSRGMWIDQPDERFDVLWQRFSKAGWCIGRRDRAFLQWRFVDQPARRYRIFAVVSAQDPDELRMYFVCEVSDSTLVVKDLLGIGSAGEMRAGLLMLCRAARQLECAAVSVQIVADASMARTLRRAMFFERGSRPFFALPAAEVCDEVARSRWYLTQADEDV